MTSGKRFPFFFPDFGERSRSRRLRPEPLLLVLLLTSGLVAGCLKSPPTPAPDLPPPAEVPVPRWSPSQSWNYTVSDGTWENRTVAGWEPRENHLAYVVYVDRPAGQEKVWHDADTLAPIAWQTNQIYARSEDCPGIFPLQNRTETCAIRAGTSYRSPPSTRRIRVKGWASVGVPAGTFHAIEIHEVPGNASGSPVTRWYSPDVEHFVKIVDDAGRTRELSSWTDGSDRVLNETSLANHSVPDHRVPPTRPADLRAPRWGVGQYWSYQGTDDSWDHWTVEDIEEIDNETTYRVRIEETDRDGTETRRQVRWYDTETLGIVRMRTENSRGNFTYANEPGAYRRFPFVSGNYTVRRTVPSYPGEHGTYDVNLTHRVAGWDEIVLSPGRFNAVRTVTWTGGDQASGFVARYDPGVENFVTYTDRVPFLEISRSTLYELEGWGVPS